MCRPCAMCFGHKAPASGPVFVRPLSLSRCSCLLVKIERERDRPVFSPIAKERPRRNKTKPLGCDFSRKISPYRVCILGLGYLSFITGGGPNNTKSERDREMITHSKGKISPTARGQGRQQMAYKTNGTTTMTLIFACLRCYNHFLLPRGSFSARHTHTHTHKRRKTCPRPKPPENLLKYLRCRKASDPLSHTQPPKKHFSIERERKKEENLTLHFLLSFFSFFFYYTQRLENFSCRIFQKKLLTDGWPGECVGGHCTLQGGAGRCSFVIWQFPGPPSLCQLPLLSLSLHFLTASIFLSL